MSANQPILFCTWCKKLIIDLPAAGEDSVLMLFPEFHRGYVNGAPAVIADGICEHCRATRFSEFPKKPFGGKDHDLAQK